MCQDVRFAPTMFSNADTSGICRSEDGILEIKFNGMNAGDVQPDLFFEPLIFPFDVFISLFGLDYFFPALCLFLIVLLFAEFTALLLRLACLLRLALLLRLACLLRAFLGAILTLQTLLVALLRSLLRCTLLRALLLTRLLTLLRTLLALWLTRAVLLLRWASRLIFAQLSVVAIVWTRRAIAAVARVGHTAPRA